MHPSLYDYYFKIRIPVNKVQYNFAFQVYYGFLEEDLKLEIFPYIILKNLLIQYSSSFFFFSPKYSIVYLVNGKFL